jgi:aryl-alcohol dehydrogenase-like predicted oxidoreductase
MNYKNLGTTDLKVSSICLGTMTWGYQNTQEDGFEQMDYALDQGINFWDTAELYAVPPRAETYGHTEVIIGNWFEQNKKRDKVILASKVAGPGRPHIRGGAYSYGIDNLTEALNDSLKRLKTDYIDLYQLHWPERPANILENLDTNMKKKMTGINLKMFWEIYKHLLIKEKLDILDYQTKPLGELINVWNFQKLTNFQE